MHPDFLNDLAELALGSRLKRLSEQMLTSAAEIYAAYDMQINPKWFTLLALLEAKKQVTVVEASGFLGLSQPALSQFCRQLSAEGLINMHTGKRDGRVRILSLSKKGKESVLRMKPIWAAVEQAAIELCTEGDNDFYTSLIKFEQAFANQSLAERTRGKMKEITARQNIEYKHNSAKFDHTYDHELKFVDYTPALAHYFESINKQWIEEMFVLEDIDQQVLSQPQSHIIDKGGKIWFVQHPQYGVVATCALLNKGDGIFELTKMGVTANARGLKVGEKLLQFVIGETQKMAVRCLFLLTNTKCEAAIHLYERNGFVHDTNIMHAYGSSYARCDVAMKHRIV